MTSKQLLTVLLITITTWSSITAQEMNFKDPQTDRHIEMRHETEEQHMQEMHKRIEAEHMKRIDELKKQYVNVKEKHKADEQDSLALVALYNATDGDNWTNNDNWLTGNVSDWHGIYLDGDSKVTYISLSNNQLNGDIPPEIGNLSNLQQLILSNNQLSGSIPPEIGNLSNLQYLFLYRNQLSGSIPPEIGNLSNLQLLILFYNTLSGSIPAEIGNLSNLQEIYLFGNQLSGSIPSTIGNLSNLLYLDLWMNQLSGSIPPEIGNLTNLIVLWLSVGNKFTDLPSLSGLTNLSHCYIENNNFDFQDLITADITATNTYEYAPQSPVSVSRTENAGQITFEYTGQGAGNQFQWYNGDTELTGETSNILTVNNTNDGAYYCLITNPNFPDLTLQTVNEEVGNSGTNHGIITEEYNALIDFYNAAGGADWFNNKHWLSDTTAHVWFGITTAGIHVKSIDLYHNNLIGILPDIVNTLIQINDLKYLILGYNQLSGSIPSTIGNLSNLENLYLSRNQLSGNILSSIGNLSNLQFLYLNNNQLSGSIPTAIGNLSNLENLTLYSNQLSGNIPTEIGNLNNLQRLDIGSNQLSGSIPASFGNLNSLETLNICDNEFNDLPDLSALSNLNSLYVYDNYFTFEDIEPNVGASFYFGYSPQAKVGSLEAHQVDIGGSLTLTVSVGGAHNTYQWYKDDTEISGAVGTTYEITDFILDDEGVYVCKINNTVATYLELVSHDKIVSNSTFYTLTFNVNDGTNAVEDAEISINNQTLTTDAGGETTIDLNNGSYDYTVTASDYELANGNVNISDGPFTENVSLISTTVSEFKSENVKIYPNPAKEYITVESSGKQNIILTIFSISGKQLISKQINEAKSRINIGELPKGLCLIKIQQGKQVIIKKLIVQ